MTAPRQYRHPDPRQLELFDESNLRQPICVEATNQMRQRSRSDGSASMQGKTRARKSKKDSKVMPAGADLSALNPSDRQVYSALLELSRNQLRDLDGDSATTTIAIGYRALSALAKVSERTLTRTLRRLESKRLIRQQPPQAISGRSTKSYQLLFQREDANIVATKKLSPLTTDDTTSFERKTSPKRKPSMRTASPRKKGLRSA